MPSGIGDQILLHGVQSISDIITEAGEINVDFADVESIMREAGSALMGMGRATGDNRAQIAAEQAISSPLLEQTNIAGAIGMIVNITAPPDFMMHELDEAMQVIKDTARDAQIIFGLVYKDELELGDEVLVTVIATGFDVDAEDVFDAQDRKYGSRYDDIDAYQRQPSSTHEQRTSVPSRTRPGTGRTLPSRSVAPVRERRSNVEPPIDQEETPPRTRQTRSAREKESTRQRSGTDWEIPAFLRVQKRGQNKK